MAWPEGNGRPLDVTTTALGQLSRLRFASVPTAFPVLPLTNGICRVPSDSVLHAEGSRKFFSSMTRAPSFKLRISGATSCRKAAWMLGCDRPPSSLSGIFLLSVAHPAPPHDFMILARGPGHLDPFPGFFSLRCSRALSVSAPERSPREV
ncbi:unnamed protein product [Prorocentrum cordatum]|uniref:Uncharacterized protein n=1 Tax=Prorocentrum cordatum TaxID=2364126 RepID=A0ABN9RZN9_9DINO|nr:unnamed protein product [Polarella glacialis]